MKSTKAKARKTTVPKDVQAAIIEGFSGHEKLYDALARLWGRTSNRIFKLLFKLPKPERLCNKRMAVAIREEMQRAMLANLTSAQLRKRKKEFGHVQAVGQQGKINVCNKGRAL